MSLFDKLFGKKEKPTEKAPEPVIGPELRRQALSLNADDLELKPTGACPHVYACLMDFPVGEHIFSVFANSGGDVSLYSTSTFGIIGGGAHESVRNAGQDWVKFMNQNVESSIPTDDIGYANTGMVRFYFLSFDGLRMLETPMVGIERSDYLTLFMAGQAVVGQLRMTSGG